MKKEEQCTENYLLRIPEYIPDLSWEMEGDEIVTLCVENKGIFHRICQKILHKPKYSYIHLDKIGSFAWKQIDGKKDILQIAELVDREFGEEAYPLYERLAQFFEILYSYRYIGYKK